MEKDISLSNLKDILYKNSIGKSLSYPDGWIKAETIIKIANMIEDGEIDRFGKKTNEDEIKI